MLPRRPFHTFTVDEILTFLNDSQKAFILWQNVFHTIFKAIGDPIYVKDSEGRFLYFNERFMTLIGKSYKELIGKTLIEVFPDEPLAKQLHELDLSMLNKHGEVNINNYTFFQEDGLVLTYPCKRLCFFDDDDQVAGVAGVIMVGSSHAHTNAILAKTVKLIKIISNFQKVVSKSLDVDTTAQDATAFLQPILNVDACVIFLTNGTSLTLKGAYPELSFVHGWRTEIAKLKRCLCKMSIQEKKIQFVENLKDIDYLKNAPCTKAGFQSLVSVPLITDDKVYGVLALASKKKRNFSNEIELLEIIGGILSVALKNALLYNEIKQTTTRYKIVADYTKNFEFWISPDFTFSYVSPASITLTGYSPDDFYNDPSLLEKIILPEDLNSWHMALNQFATDTFNMRIRTKTGEIRWTEALVYKIFTDDGKFLGIRGSISDATQKFESKMAEKKSQRLLLSIFNGINDSMFMIDRDYRIQMINKAALEYFGVNETKAMGAKCYEVLANREQPCERCASLLDSGATFTEFEKVIHRGERECMVKVSLHRVEDQEHDINGTLVHVKDITKEKIIEREIINTEKLTMLGILSASMAHEINHPNNLILFNMPILRDYISALVNLIEQKGGPNACADTKLFGLPYEEFIEDLFKLLGNIEEGGNRIKEIINRLQLFMRPADLKNKKRVYLGDVIERALKMCITQLNKKVKKVDVQVASEVQNVYINPLCLEHVLVNLILNATQAMDKPDSYLGIYCVKGHAWDESIVIEVRDNGQGIDASELSKIFRPFYSKSSGTGLGLFIAKNLIDSLGGTIEVESKKGLGSTFRISLPI